MTVSSILPCFKKNLIVILLMLIWLFSWKIVRRRRLSTPLSSLTIDVVMFLALCPLVVSEKWYLTLRYFDTIMVVFEKWYLTLRYFDTVILQILKQGHSGRCWDAGISTRSKKPISARPRLSVSLRQNNTISVRLHKKGENHSLPPSEARTSSNLGLS